MPDIAQKITIDRKHCKVFVDGVEFPWMIAERGPEVENVSTKLDVPIVFIPVLATDVEVIAREDE
ncbi:hypothetical protein JZX82_gp10 [Gordonia phage William]|uniref:Uncharacterized protein n=1 Tax=Gordonia phage William TaxID=2571253 RepID=A0A4Y6EGG7_9CAUD|nr:hypothetical protein JZX82_gp10 [Gordonia phage William]QDF17105.1 hypothetical protein SEA_WILLIAM_10 [Gordonia phage William]